MGPPDSFKNANTKKGEHYYSLASLPDLFLQSSFGRLTGPWGNGGRSRTGSGNDGRRACGWWASFGGWQNPSALESILDIWGDIDLKGTWKVTGKVPPLPLLWRQIPFSSHYRYDGGKKTKTKQTQKHRDKCGLSSLSLRRYYPVTDDCRPHVLGLRLSWVQSPDTLLPTHLCQPSSLIVLGAEGSLSFIGQDRYLAYSFPPLERKGVEITLSIARPISISETFSWREVNRRDKKTQ